MSLRQFYTALAATAIVVAAICAGQTWLSASLSAETSPAGTIVVESPIGTFVDNETEYRVLAGGAVTWKTDTGWMTCGDCRYVVLPQIMSVGRASQQTPPPNQNE